MQIALLKVPQSDRIRPRLRIPHHEHTESKTKPKSQERIWRDRSRNGRDQRADPNGPGPAIPRSGERVGKVYAPAAPARPRREIRRARGDAEEEEEEAAAATRRDAMVVDSFTQWLSGSSSMVGDAAASF